MSTSREGTAVSTSPTRALFAFWYIAVGAITTTTSGASARLRASCQSRELLPEPSVTHLGSVLPRRNRQGAPNAIRLIPYRWTSTSAGDAATSLRLPAPAALRFVPVASVKKLGSETGHVLVPDLPCLRAGQLLTSGCL